MAANLTILLPDGPLTGAHQPLGMIDQWFACANYAPIACSKHSYWATVSTDLSISSRPADFHMQPPRLDSSLRLSRTKLGRHTRHTPF